MTEVKFYSQQTHSSYKEDYVSPTILQRAGAIGGGQLCAYSRQRI